jgi:hypothetical protein
LAKQFTEAAREETDYDNKTGRPYRVYHAISQKSGQLNLFVYVDIQDITRNQMLKSTVNRREQMVRKGEGGWQRVVGGAARWRRTFERSGKRIGKMINVIPPGKLAIFALAVDLVAAGCWFRASCIHIPTDLHVEDVLASGYGSVVGLKEMSDGFQKQGNWNAVAAAMTGVAVLLNILARLRKAAE